MYEESTDLIHDLGLSSEGDIAWSPPLDSTSPEAAVEAIDTNVVAKQGVGVSMQ